MKRRFAIALSFPGQHRRFVRNVANSLARSLGRRRVFFDEWYGAELKGSGADLKLSRVYRDDAELVVPFFSHCYSKMWCQIEWHAIRAVLAHRREEDAVVPVHLDKTEIPGWEIIDLGIRRKAGQSASRIADELLQVYRGRAQRAASPNKLRTLPPEEPTPSAPSQRPRIKSNRPGHRPAVVLMDSTLPAVVYDRDTLKQGGTNADDITDILSDLPISLIKETTSLRWRRDEQVLGFNPDLIVLHFSAFYDTTTPDDAEKRLEEFLTYLSSADTCFLLYSRMSAEQFRWLQHWVRSIEKRTPALRNRIHVLPIERGPRATFRDPGLARRLKIRVKELLKL
jgi:hypothetical protein